ncbi:hypothetical protein BC938DRAFT_483527 [Jimgerdemannia flammicorona]|uniref:Uncharacterized protein n=1 Tax=Jimgerdemannia flammicorona TaxID=994334 RepID=A0A433QBQ9_9FUNG|nr:hypothetical protein BC938DRAFT_483527 [Jimgerdemannia flammicorona]
MTTAKSLKVWFIDHRKNKMWVGTAKYRVCYKPVTGIVTDEIKTNNKNANLYFYPDAGCKNAQYYAHGTDTVIGVNFSYRSWAYVSDTKGLPKAVKQYKAPNSKISSNSNSTAPLTLIESKFERSHE